ncbi:hypothetical protein [Leptothrix ochracea]|uniref:hypothetical protein n=1 Tax=Leptothrix ochracea TaxID=735331 RepID=UPI0034E278E8
MKQHRPHGPAPTALEANVLKLMALEMILFVFYMEDLRRFIIKAVTLTYQFQQQPAPLPAGDILKKATRTLLDAGVLSKDQRTEFNKLIAYRNIIGHEHHFLTVDVGAYADLAEMIAIKGKSPSGYDGTMLDRVIKMRKHLHEAVAKKFIMELSFDSLMFEAAEKTYLNEIKRLKSEISSQIKELTQHAS